MLVRVARLVTADLSLALAGMGLVGTMTPTDGRGSGRPPMQGTMTWGAGQPAKASASGSVRGTCDLPHLVSTRRSFRRILGAVSGCLAGAPTRLVEA